jgi:hypothetical protein
MAQATGRFRPNNFPMDGLLKMTCTLAVNFRNPADEESGRLCSMLRPDYKLY